MKINNTILLAIILFFSLEGYGQDPQFTQFYANPLYQAPSFAGSVKGYRFALNYRNQWPSMPGKLTTMTAALDYNLSALNSGLGISIMRDVSGSIDYTNLQAGFLYAYNARLAKRVYFRPGIGFHYTQRSMNYSKMIFSSELESGGNVIPESEFQNINDVDGSASALLLTNQWWTGVTVDHLLMPNISVSSVESRMPVKYTFFGGYRFQKIERLISTKRQSVTVAGTYRHQGATDQLDLGMYWSYHPIILGVWYRDLPFIKDYSRRDALALLVGYQYEGLNVGYSYDFTVSRLITSTGGAHEISLVYKFELEQKKKFRPIPCPTF